MVIRTLKEVAMKSSQRYVKRGKGVPIKSFPALTVDYFRKVEELKADYIFILDKPVVGEEFFF